MRNNKVLWITETAAMLALLIVLQAVTKSFGQFVTGSCVNGVLAITVLVCGMSSGVTVALLSPVFAYFLGIAPQIVTVPAIMAGNTVYVLLLYWISGRDGKNFARKIIALLIAAVSKFAVLYVLVVWLICSVLSEGLLSKGILKQPMLQVLTANFSWPQLVTALLGGGVALLIVPILKKARKR